MPDESFDLALSEYGASIWCDPCKWIPRRRGCSGPGGELVFLCNATAGRALLARRAGRKGGRAAAAAAVRHAPARLADEDEGVEFQMSHGEMDAALAGQRVRGRGPLRSSTRRSETRRSTVLRLGTGRMGAEVARPRRSGRPASAGERPAGAADHPRFALAPAARDPRAARHPVRRRPAEVRGARRRSTRARGGEGALRRGRGPAGARRRHRGRRRRRGARQAGRRRPRRRRCWSGCPGGRTRSSRAFAFAHARGRSCTRETTRVTFRPLTARDLAHYIGSGEWQDRAGGYAIQGLGGSLVERLEGDYLNVVGLPAALLVRLLAARFPGTYGFG